MLVTSLFFLWGLSYGLLDVLNKHFQETLHVSKAQSGLLQAAYFGAYFIIALPAGLLMDRELEWLTKASRAPEHPSVALIGGAKVSDKIEVIQNLLKVVDQDLETFAGGPIKRRQHQMKIDRQAVHHHDFARPGERGALSLEQAHFERADLFVPLRAQCRLVQSWPRPH